MKKIINKSKGVVLFYLIAIVLVLLLSNRMEKLDSREDRAYQNEGVILKVR